MNKPITIIREETKAKIADAINNHKEDRPFAGFKRKGAL